MLANLSVDHLISNVTLTLHITLLSLVVCDVPLKFVFASLCRAPCTSRPCIMSIDFDSAALQTQQDEEEYDQEDYAREQEVWDSWLQHCKVVGVTSVLQLSYICVYLLDLLVSLARVIFLRQLLWFVLELLLVWMNWYFQKTVIQHIRWQDIFRACLTYK